MYCHCEHLKYILPGCRPTRMTVSSVLDLCITLLLLIIPACLATSTTPAPGESLWYPPLSLSVTPFSFSSLSSLSLASSISLSYPLPYFLLITLRLSLSLSQVPSSSVVVLNVLSKHPGTATSGQTSCVSCPQRTGDRHHITKTHTHTLPPLPPQRTHVMYVLLQTINISHHTYTHTDMHVHTAVCPHLLSLLPAHRMAFTRVATHERL